MISIGNITGDGKKGENRVANLLIKDVEILRADGRVTVGSIAITDSEIVSVGDLPANW